jgi:hypothetical protein
MARSTANLLVTLEGTSDKFRKKRDDKITKYLDYWGESLKMKIEREEKEREKKIIKNIGIR